MATKKPLAVTPIETSISTTKKLSIAVGLLSFAAFVIQGLSSTWGFESVGEQITQTCLLFSGAVNLFFLGDTSRKITEERKQNGES